MSVAICISSLFILIWEDFEWTWYGFVGAVLWTCGNDFAMVAVAKLGVRQNILNLIVALIS